MPLVMHALTSSYSGQFKAAVKLTQTLHVKGWLVMVSELSDEHRVIAYLVDEAMLIIDTPRPVAR
jgi:hypothetical protein